MSRASILSMVSRIERIADMLPGKSERELLSLGGQVMGTMRAIEREFAASGISVKNQGLSDLGGSWRDTSEAVFALHQAAAYFRGLAERID